MPVRECGECGEVSNIPSNKTYCCLRRGQRPKNAPKHARKDASGRAGGDFSANTTRRAGKNKNAANRLKSRKNGRFLLVAIGDTHFPWADNKRLERIYDYIAAVNPTHVVQMGDIYDFYSWSRYSKSLIRVTPDEELRMAREQAEKMWAEVQRRAPNAQCHQVLGNHDDRLYKQIVGKAPEYEAVLDYLNAREVLWGFDGVITQESSRDELVIRDHLGRDIMIHHGHRSKLGAHADFNNCRTIVGHTHKGGVVHMNRRDDTIWELNAGYVADQASFALAYSPQKLSQSVPGFGVVDEWGPRFVPLED